MTVASFLPHRGREVENARHGAIYETSRTQRRPAGDAKQTSLTEASKFTVEYVCAGTAHIVVTIVLKKEGDIHSDSPCWDRVETHIINIARDAPTVGDILRRVSIAR